MKYYPNILLASILAFSAVLSSCQKRAPKPVSVKEKGQGIEDNNAGTGNANPAETNPNGGSNPPLVDDTKSKILINDASGNQVEIPWDGLDDAIDPALKIQ